MRYRKRRHVPAPLNRRSRRNSGWKIAFLALAALMTVFLAVVLTRPQAAPFSSVTPAVSPLETTPTAELPVSTDTISTDNPDDATVVPDEDSGNPVETAYQMYAQFAASPIAAFDGLTAAHPLRLLSFKLAFADANGMLDTARACFADATRGATPGEWARDGATISASGGSYTLYGEVNGHILKGTVNSTMTRIRCELYEDENATEAQSFIELVKGADGYYGQMYDAASVYKTVRFSTGLYGVSVAMNGAPLPSIYEETPVSWASFSAECAESMRATEGGAVLKIGNEEIICSADEGA